MQDGTTTAGADAAMPQMDPGQFRKVMGSFATGVTVVTTVARGQVHGMTVSAFMSGSLVPPLCVISIRKQARMHPLLIDAGHFGVSILTKNQERISTHFAGAPVADLALEYVWAGRTPLLANSASVIAADIAAQHECGDHTLLIGRIQYLAAYDRSPLLVHQGRYASASHAAEPAPEWVTDFW
ncbi:MAG: flavin reductase family protein [Hyphomicrobiaceae bacterium]|nr:flavin reductase family protein [Hyphomicrobiaceae bacterium]